MSQKNIVYPRTISLSEKSVKGKKLSRNILNLDTQTIVNLGTIINVSVTLNYQANFGARQI